MEIETLTFEEREELYKKLSEERKKDIEYHVPFRKEYFIFGFCGAAVVKFIFWIIHFFNFVWRFDLPAQLVLIFGISFIVYIIDSDNIRKKLIEERKKNDNNIMR